MKIKIEFEIEGDKILQQKYKEFLEKKNQKLMADRLMKAVFYALEVPIDTRIKLDHMIIQASVPEEAENAATESR